MNPAARKFHRLRPSPAGLAALVLVTLLTPVPAVPLQAALADGTNLLIAWNGRGTLETAPHPAANWQQLTNVTSPHRHRPTNASAFFRLNQTVDATTLHRKVLCGYQGWFRAPGDGGSQWIHWSRDPRQITTSTVTFEMWPDLAEFGPDERYPAGQFTHPDGSPAHLFSSQNSNTVHRHFDWMRDYGIDGVFVQRFVSDIPDRPWMTNVLNHARAAARRTGRVLALTYDLSGAPTNTVFSRLTNDWRWLALETGLTGDPRYLHHAGRPVLMVWGFFADRMHPGLAAQIIGWFRTNPIQPVTLVGGCQWWWRTESAPGWSNVFRQFDVISPWNVGNYSTAGTNKWASTAYWAADRAAAAAAGMLYLPVLYPGFSWDNLQRLPPGTSLIPRRGGEFFWRQFHDAAQLSLDMAYVAMFDEVDEGTAIFKVSNTPPTQGYWVTYDGLPTDWYLRLTAAGTAMLAGERPLSATIPITP